MPLSKLICKGFEFLCGLNRDHWGRETVPLWNSPREERILQGIIIGLISSILWVMRCPSLSQSCYRGQVFVFINVNHSRMDLIEKGFCCGWQYFIQNHLFFSVSVLCSQRFTLKLNLQPRRPDLCNFHSRMILGIFILELFFLLFFLLIFN